MVRHTALDEIGPDAFPRQSRDELLGRMGPQLRKECAAIEASLLKEEGGSLQTEHELGRRVQRLRDEARYGSRAVDRVAAACGVDPSRLYRAGRFAEVYPDLKAVQKLVARRGEGGTGSAGPTSSR